jgi:outer membrane protein
MLLAPLLFALVELARPDELFPAPAHAVTLPEARSYARAHQPSLRAALARITAAEDDARVARAQWLPSLGATAQGFAATASNSTATTLGVRGVDLPRIGGTRVPDHPTMTPSVSTLVAGGLDQELVDFGRIGRQAAAADAAVTVARLAAEEDLLRLDLLVKESFYAVLGARAVLRAATDAHARAQAHSDLAAAGVRSGLHAPIELTRAEADLTRFEVARVQALGSLRTAQTALAAALGSPERALDAAGDPAAVPEPPSLEEALLTLDRRDADVRRAAAEVAQQQAATRAIAAESRPDVWLSAGISGRAGAATPSSGPSQDGWLPDTPNWHAGLVLRWQIFDPLVRARARSARAREDVASAALAVVRQQESAALQRAYVQLAVARASLQALGRAAEAARANHAQAEARFKAGLGTGLELADAEAVRTGAEIQLAIGQFDVGRARALIARLLAEDS